MRINKQQVYRLVLQLFLIAVFVTPVFAEDVIELEVGYEALEEYMSFELEDGYIYESSDDRIASVEENKLIANRFGDCILYKKNSEGTILEAIEVIVYLVGDEPVPWGSVNITNAYISGYPDNSFKPKNFITRAEIATMFSKLLDLTYDEPVGYIDLLEDHWAFDYIQSVVTNDLMRARAENEFYPNAYLTKAEMARIISVYADRMGFNLNEEPKKIVMDVPFSHPDFQSIHQVMNVNLLLPEEGYFHPDDFITRIEAVELINHITGRSFLYQNNVNFTDVTSEDTFFEALQSASFSY